MYHRGSKMFAGRGPSGAGSGAADNENFLWRTGDEEEQVKMRRGKRLPHELLSYDPLLARMLSLDSLDPAAQLNWICTARRTLLRIREEVASEPPASLHDECARKALLKLLEIKLSALDELYERIIAKEGKTARSTELTSDER